MVKNNTLYIVMPAYNEEENIRLVVADSGSSDKTHEILLRCMPALRYIKYYF